MEFVNVRDLRTNSMSLWRKMKKSEDVILTLKGKPIALMIGMTEENFQPTLDVLTRLRGMLVLKEIQKQAAEKGKNKMTMEEIDREIALVRKARRERSQ